MNALVITVEEVVDAFEDPHHSGHHEQLRVKNLKQIIRITLLAQFSFKFLD